MERNLIEWGKQIRQIAGKCVAHTEDGSRIIEEGYHLMSSSQNEDEWLSMRQAAEMLGMHPATVRLWADRNELPSRRTTGGHRRFRRSDIEARLQQEVERKPDPAAHLLVQLVDECLMSFLLGRRSDPADSRKRRAQTSFPGRSSRFRGLR